MMYAIIMDVRVSDSKVRRLGHPYSNCTKGALPLSPSDKGQEVGSSAAAAPSISIITLLIWIEPRVIKTIPIIIFFQNFIFSQNRLDFRIGLKGKYPPCANVPSRTRITFRPSICRYPLPLLGVPSTPFRSECRCISGKKEVDDKSLIP